MQKLDYKKIKAGYQKPEKPETRNQKPETFGVQFAFSIQRSIGSPQHTRLPVGRLNARKHFHGTQPDDI